MKVADILCPHAFRVIQPGTLRLRCRPDKRRVLLRLHQPRVKLAPTPHQLECRGVHVQCAEQKLIGPSAALIVSSATKPSGIDMVNNQNLVQESRTMSIHWAAIDWVSLIARTLLVLIAVRIGERLSLGSRALHAALTAVVFALGFAVCSYYGLDDTVNSAVAALTTPSSG